MTVLITQSNYIPWKGYFDAINQADVFVVYDEMQYTRRDWRNRNKIKTQKGTQWLSIPVHSVFGESKISEVTIADEKWASKHLNMLRHNYAKSEYYEEIMDWLESLYLRKYTRLSKINLAFIKAINQYLNISTKIIDSATFNLSGGKTNRLVHICKMLEADHYITGPSAANYMDEEQFAAQNIKLEYLDFSGYPEYLQLYGDFRHYVTILDLLFNTGPEAKQFMKSFTNNKS